MNIDQDQAKLMSFKICSQWRKEYFEHFLLIGYQDHKISIASNGHYDNIRKKFFNICAQRTLSFLKADNDMPIELRQECLIEAADQMISAGRLGAKIDRHSIVQKKRQNHEAKHLVTLSEDDLCAILEHVIGQVITQAQSISIMYQDAHHISIDNTSVTVEADIPKPLQMRRT